jgi:sterol desaturase/sphingolipid hydroxylase (fatty acid hydroxylase superfamily)
MITSQEKSAVLIGLLILLYILECLFPYYTGFQKKTRHAFRNIGLISINAVLFNLALTPMVIFATSQSWGLFHRYAFDWKVELALTVLAIDLLTYATHVLFHVNPFLWRFHRMHHSDTEMDATSGSRFHIGEHAITTTIRCVIYASLGVRLEFLVLYETVFIANVLFHHANLSMGNALDRIYRIVLTSPDMHKVHHSHIREEHDSNYTSLFSIWDRVFGTFQISDDPKRIVYGINGLDDDQTIRKMFLTPAKPLIPKTELSEE